MSIKRSTRAIIQSFVQGGDVVHSGSMYYLDPEKNHLQNAYEYWRMGEKKAAAQIAIKGLTRASWFRNHERMIKKLRPELDINGVGAESVTVKEGNEAKKYLTAKTRHPRRFLGEVRKRHDVTEPYLRNFIPDTKISIEAKRLFRNDKKPQEYVTLTQPFIDILHVNPHKNPELIDAVPGLRQSLLEFAVAATELYQDTGYIIDLVNEGNLVIGRIDESEDYRLIYLDTLCVHKDDKDMPGLVASRTMWSPQPYFDSLVEFVAQQDPTIELY